MQTNWQSSVLVLITPQWYSFSIVGAMPNESPYCNCFEMPSGSSISTMPFIKTLHESNSSPSFITTVPAFSTTANTMELHKARLIVNVIFVNALRFCVNPSSTSTSCSVRSVGSFSKQSRTVSRMLAFWKKLKRKLI